MDLLLSSVHMLLKTVDSLPCISQQCSDVLVQAARCERCRQQPKFIKKHSHCVIDALAYFMHPITCVLQAKLACALCCRALGISTLLGRLPGEATIALHCQ